MIFVFCVLQSYEARYINVITIFLYSFFIEEIYMKLPHDYEEEDYICCFNKILYNLK